jgi:FAD dependent oxidoreductase
VPDVVVYGGTAAGVMAAVAAARRGATVALLEPSRYVGGMVSGGLGRSDVERQEALIGGLALEFARRVGRVYGTEVAWRFEPSVAERVLGDMLEEHRVDVRLGWRLASAGTDARIAEVTEERGERVPGGSFVDATYEGDLLAAAGVSFALGRESIGLHGERYAGRRELLPSPHQFAVPISPLADRGGLLPDFVHYDDLVAPGEGDGRVQSYCYRVCLSDRGDRIPVPPPPGYDAERYELVRRYAAALGDRASFRSFGGPGRLPNGKADLNSDGPVSTNLPGAGQGWVDGDTTVRSRIAEEHRRWAQGLLHFLATDRRLPAALRRETTAWGLPPDEFPDNDHWPHQLYVREGRRMIGRRVLTERDLFAGGGARERSIGLAGYNIDIREVHWVAVPISRFPDLVPEALTEGYVSVPVPPSRIPFDILLPSADECADLVVACAVSASHVAWCALRLEPQFMILGEAAGAAAAIAAERGIGPGDVPMADLHTELARHGARVDLPA